MVAYIARRIISSSLTLLVVAVIAFMLIHLTPGDPVAIALGEEATAEQIASVRKAIGLDDPIPIQFVRWVGRIAFHFDLGQSLHYGEPVLSVFSARAEPTILFALLAFMIAVAIGVTSGVSSAVHTSGIRGQVTMLIAMLGISTPSFALGLLLMYVFSLYLGMFPVAGYSPVAEGVVLSLWHLLLPSFALGFAEAAFIARVTRASLVEVLHADFIRTARSKGLMERVVIYKHGLRTVAYPVVTVVGLSIARVLGGSVILEEIFGLPGIGRLLITAIRRRDYPIIQAAVMLVGIVYMFVNLLVDIVFAYFDPRIRYE